MNNHFFADYKKFVVVPEDEKTVDEEVFDPKNYAAFYILTVSIYDSRLSTWRDTGKFGIDAERSIKTVLGEFNKRQRGKYHIQLLELDKFTNYFILALSFKTKPKSGEEQERISYVVDKLLSNPFYIGQKWYNLTGEKGRVERRLFCFSFKEYLEENEEQYENVEIISKNREFKLVKNSPKRDAL